MVFITRYVKLLLIFLYNFYDLVHTQDVFVLSSDYEHHYSVNINSYTLPNDGIKAYISHIKGGANHFHILIRNTACPLQRTSTFAKDNHCDVAVNGGPFSSYIKGGCVGAVVQDGETSVPTFSSNYAAFGATFSNEWVIGFVPDEKTAKELKVRDLITGLNGWLVRGGQVIPEEDNVPAPRTAIGVKEDGSLVIFQVDGCEHCWFQAGLSLRQLATLLVSDEIGVKFAVNLDGGGSSTTVVDGAVVNHPTCLDYINLKCERPVGSAVCIKSTSYKKATTDIHLEQ